MGVKQIVAGLPVAAAFDEPFQADGPLERRAGQIQTLRAREFSELGAAEAFESDSTQICL